MTRWRLIRLVARLLLLGVFWFCLGLAIGHLYTAQQARPSYEPVRGPLIAIVVMLGISLPVAAIGAALTQPKPWKGHTPADFEREAKVIRLTRQLCRHRLGLDFTLPVSRDCTLKCEYPTKTQIRHDIWKLLLLGGNWEANLSFTFQFRSSKPDDTLPEDQIYYVPFLGGAYHCPEPGKRSKLDAIDLDRLIERLTVALEQATES